MNPQALWSWAPAALLGFGALMSTGIDRQKVMPLRAELDATVPAEIDGFASVRIEVSDEELQVAGVSDYLMRAYASPATVSDPAAAVAAPAFTVYVGYYDQQTQGKTIHSPKNCLPGAGWDALQSRRVAIAGPNGPMVVNRYMLQREQELALVLYWYQGRGRIEANEYVVKANLLRDSALRGRSEEALVRIVVPLDGTSESAELLAANVARDIATSLEMALPAS